MFNIKMDNRIEDFVPGDYVQGYYLLKEASVKISSAGDTYLAGKIMDKSGTVDIRMWAYEEPIGTSNEGEIVKIRGTVSEYRDKTQVILDRIRLTDVEDDYDLSEIVPVAPIDAEQTIEYLESVVDSLDDKDYALICREMMDKYRGVWTKIPAGKSVHHAFVNGLLMHTANMVKIACCAAEIYKEFVDRDLLLAGTFLHDFGKMKEFTISSTGLVTEYSREGQLLGHLVIGAQEVTEIARKNNLPEEKQLLLQHMLLSHHGEPEYGAAVVPVCAEAELLSRIDMMDSRMEIYREVLEQTEKGKFSDRNFYLGHNIYKHKEISAPASVPA